MKKLIQLKAKEDPAARGSFLIVPDKLTAGQARALAEIRRLLRYSLEESPDA